MRFPKPFFRTSKRAWYLQLGKRQISLGQDRSDAFKHYREILFHETGRLPDAAPDQTVAGVFDLFLEWAGTHTESYDWYRHFLQGFADLHGALSIAELKPFHVTRWLAGKEWGSTTQNKAVGILKRAFNWALSEGVIATNPLKAVKKPPAKRRDCVLSIAERKAIFDSYRASDPFRDFLFSLQETGARPGEVATVTSADVDLAGGVWVLARHKTAKKTGKPRVIILTPGMIELSRKLMARNAEGPLFRNMAGRPWTRNAVRCRFRRIREKLGLGRTVVSYLYRHSFCTDALENGVGVVQVAELLGHSSTDMIMRHYQHLHERREHLRAMVIKATQKHDSECA